MSKRGSIMRPSVVAGALLFRGPHLRFRYRVHEVTAALETHRSSRLLLPYRRRSACRAQGLSFYSSPGNDE
ncbi:hypothetical protein DPMN_030946 [Dreissena polymorpha]|uniref:Uncharacterized protein n=1 Tax=Dreissena polymorpha TaxID=45954 RepID=A0A9D4RGV0_DREPO|nr:hypothetical protein DPMN_030946 [Dreissena polymorpha]